MYAIGNPLTDSIMDASHSVLEDLKAAPGSMNLVEAQIQSSIEARARIRIRVPGGSASNTARGFAWLAEHLKATGPVYTGAVGRDSYGTQFESMLRAAGVEPRLAFKDQPTGSSVILVTDDHERTMFTHLGACRELVAEDIDSTLLAQSSLAYLTGYMWDTPNQEHAAHHIIETAARSGTPLAFDVADPFVAERYRDALMTYLPGKVSIFFANLQEARSLARLPKASPPELFEALSHLAPHIVIKLGNQGCTVSTDKVRSYEPLPVQARDTTGAGDAFAGAYLFGITQKYSVDTCADLANRLAGQIVTVDGCDFDRVQIESVTDLVPGS